MLRRFVNAVLILAIVSSATSMAHAQRLYFTNNAKKGIWSADLDGKNVKPVIKGGLIEPRGLSIDHDKKKLYWVDYGLHKIQRSNLDGTGVEDVISRGIRGPRGIALDLAGQKIYWTDKETQRIQRANMDGTGVEDLVTQGLRYPYSICLDTAKGFMYWEDHESLRIQRAKLDGTDVQTIFDLIETPGFLPVGMDLDLTHGHIYFADGGERPAIQRTNLTGNGMRLIVPMVAAVRAVAVEKTTAKLYWVESLDDSDVLRRADLDGQGVEDIVAAPLFSIRAVTFDTP